MKKNLLILGLLVATADAAFGVTLSASGEELRYSYEVSFRALARGQRLGKTAAREAAKFHAAHLFGFFHTPEMAEKHGFPADLIEGFAGTKVPQVDSAEAFEVEGDEYPWVRYKAHGTAVVLKSVVRTWLGESRRGSVSLPLLRDLPAIYQPFGANGEFRFREERWKECGDDHYYQAKEFSYFYNWIRCPELGSEPIATSVSVEIERTVGPGEEARRMFPREDIHGDNGNGKVMLLYFVTGFDSTPPEGASPAQIRRDLGWKTYEGIGDMLARRGFERMETLENFKRVMGAEIRALDDTKRQTPVSLVHDEQRRYFSTYVKKTPTHTFVVRSGLFDADNERVPRPRTFPRFWKEAWENGDVVYYGGHSGDGVALQLSTLLATLNEADIGTIRFRRNKTQVAVFDSCSAYAWYQDLYFKKNPEKLHLVTPGLVSLFHLAQTTIDAFMDLSLSEGPAPTWVEALREVEKRQIPPHVDFLYSEYSASYRSSKRKYFRDMGLYPTALTSVRVAD